MFDKSGNNTRVAIIGGGVAGLATAINLLDLAKARETDITLTVFEKEDQPGGNLRTLRKDGWQMEWGPNGFLDNEPATLRLVDRLGLDEQLERSSDAARRRFLLINGRLQEIPTSPPAFLKSGMMPLTAKLRMAGELFVPGRKDLGVAAERPETDETIAAFGERRLGKAFTEVMLDPMVKGVFGGEAKQLSLAAAFPRMVELENQYGGLFRAMIALSRNKKRADKTDAGPSGTLHSFFGGMATLIDALAAELETDARSELVLSAETQAINRISDAWEVTVHGENHGPFDMVIDAAPAHAAAGHLKTLDEEIANALQTIPFSPMAVIALGFPRDQVAHDLDGFGLLVPGREKRDLLGALWTSSIFSGRSPGDRVLIRCMAGGSGNPTIMSLTDDELTGVICSELRPLLGLRGKPEMVTVIRHERAIAQYLPGHLARLKKIDQRLEQHPGLFLAGSSYRGIAVNACLKQAENLADKIIHKLSSPVPPVRTESP